MNTVKHFMPSVFTVDQVHADFNIYGFNCKAGSTYNSFKNCSLFMQDILNKADFFNN